MPSQTPNVAASPNDPTDENRARHASAEIAPEDAAEDAAEDAPVDKAILSYLTSAPSSEFYGESVEVNRAWQGRDNLLWQVTCGARTAVVKLFLDAGQARGRRQYDGHATYADLRIAPRPLWFDRYPQGLARQVLLYSWVEGDTLTEAHAQIKQESSVRDALAQTVATVHTWPLEHVRRFCPHPINLDYFWRIESDALRQAIESLEFSNAKLLCQLLAAIARHAETEANESLALWQDAAPAPVHGDLQPDNCLVSPAHTGSSIVLLDWEYFGLGDPALDMARLLFHLHPLWSPQARALFLQVYLDRMDRPGLHARIAVYEQLLPIQAVAYLINGVQRAVEAAASSPTKAARAEVLDGLPLVTAAVTAALARIDISPYLGGQPEGAVHAVEEWAAQLSARLAHV